MNFRRPAVKVVNISQFQSLMANMKFGYVQLDSALLHKISQWYGVRFQSYNLKINYKFKIVQVTELSRWDTSSTLLNTRVEYYLY